MVRCDGARFRSIGSREPLGRAGDALRGRFAARKIVLEALDLLLLAIHEVNVVAEKQVQVLDAGPRQLYLNRIELKQQVVAKGPDQRQAGSNRMAEFVDQRAEHRERRRLFAAFLFGEKLRKRLQLSAHRAGFPGETFPMRMRREQRMEKAIQYFAASIQRAKFHVAPGGYDLERRRERCEIPPGITLGVLIAGGKIYAALRVEFAQQPVQSAVVGHSRNSARNRDATGC